jgi:ribosome-associated protein
MNIKLIRKSIYSEAETVFSRSGGPGGQNVNKLNTKVTLKMPFSLIEGLNEPEKERVKRLLGNRINNGGEIVLSSDEERSRHTNLERAYFRMEALITSAARLPKHRRPTKHSKVSIKEKKKKKKLHSIKKAERQNKDC